MTFFSTENYITTREASERSGYSSDYLARLVRSGKITGKKVGHSWLIEKKSLEHFLNEQDGSRSERVQELARERAREYILHRDSRLKDKYRTEPSYALRSQALSLSVAFLVITFGATLSQAALTSHVNGRAAALLRDIVPAFNSAMHAIPSRFSERIDFAGSGAQAALSQFTSSSAHASRSIALSMPDINDFAFTRTELDCVDSSCVRGSIVSRPKNAFRTDISSPSAVTADDLRAYTAGMYAFLTSPSRVADTLAHAYVSTGNAAYEAIRKSFFLYDSFINDYGTKSLELAAAARDVLDDAPYAGKQLAARVNLTLGKSIIDATDAAISADVAVAYRISEAAPASAHATVAFVGAVGDTLANGAARAAVEAPARIVRTVLILSETGPYIARQIFNAEYAVSAQFIALTNVATEKYALILRSFGDAGYAFVAAPVKVASALGAMLPMNAMRDFSKLSIAAALPALSMAEQAAFSIYESINGFFSFAGRTIANVFVSPSPAPEVVEVTPTPTQPAETVQPQARPAGATTVTNSTPLITGNVTRVSNSYPTYTTVIQGVSPAYMEQSLASLRTELLSTIANSIRPVTSQTVTNAQTIQMVNKIEDVSNLIVRNGDFRNSVFDNGVRVSATTGSFTSLSSGATTISGDLTVSGTITPGTISAGNSISAPYFTATSTTATSTFAGMLAIGTTTPDNSAALDINSTTRGMLPPRLTTVQKNALASPASGLTLYDSTLNKLNVYNGTAWKNVGSTEIGGEVTSGSTGSVLFIGDGAVLGQDNANFNYSTSTGKLSFGSASTSQLSIFNSAYFGGTATSTFNSAGDLLVVGSTTLRNFTATNATTTNLFSTTASSTNLFSQTASLSTLTLENALAVTSGGTGQSTFTSSQLLYGNGTAALSSVATSSLAVGTGLTNSGTLGAQIGGSAANISFAAIAANSLWVNQTGASAVPTAIATSSLFTWTGTGDVVRSTSPTLVTPALGTPSALVLTNATGLPVGGGGTGLSSVADGSLLFGSGGTALTALATTSNAGRFLSLDYTTGRPSWVATSSLNVNLTNVTGTLAAAQFPALTGDVTTTAGSLTTAIGANKVTLGMLATLAANSIIGNITGAVATPTAIATSSLFTWTGTGDVVRATSPTLITPALGTPSALVLTNATGLPVAGGGTGLSSVADGSLLFGSGSTALTALATTSGSGRFLSLDYTTGRPSWVATSSLNVDLSNTTGTLAVARGGTGQTSFTSDQIHYGNFATVATTTFTPSAEFTVGGTIGALVGGANSTLTLATNGVGLTKLAQIAANTILGNTTGATANVTAIATSSLFTWTGTGDVVRATSPTLITPALGTPSALVLTNATGLPVAGGGTGLSSVADGSLLFGSGSTALTALATTSGSGRFLSLDYTTGRPSWVATSSLNVDLSNTTGTLAVARGGTGQTSFGQGWLHSDGTTFTSSTSPTVAYLTATSTTATSTFAAGIQATYLNVTGTSATSTFARGIDLAGGCFAIGGVCIGSGGVGTGAIGQLPFYNAAGTNLTATSTIFLTQAGNFGIGTTTPSAKLEITNTLSGTTADQLYLTNLASATSTASRLTFRAQDLINNTGTSTAAITSILQQNFNGGKGDLAFSVLTTGALTEAGRFTNAGFLGIGTTTPAYKLTINSANATDNLFQIATTTNQGIMLVNNQGNVGIGTTSPAYMLDVGGSSAFGTGSEAMRIDTTGNVGIGTSTPYATLSVLNNTSSLVDVFAIATSTSGIVFKVDSYGRTYGDGAYASPAADYAEYFYTNSVDLKSGEVVCVDILENNAVKRCERGADNNVMGIVSTKPSVIGNFIKESQTNPSHYAIIGMMGQVDAYASAENGAINIGDSLTSASSTPGYAMRADGGDSTVGIALEPLREGSGKIKVLISRRNKSLAVEEVESLVVERIANMKIEDSVQQMIQLSVDNLDFEDRFNKLNTLLTVGVNDNTASIARLDEAFSTLTASSTDALSVVEEALLGMNLNLEAMASTTASSTPASDSFVSSFFSNIFARVTTWLADATNGIGDVFARTFKASDKLCINDTCVTEEQLKALLAGVAASPVAESSGSVESSGSSTAPVETDTATTTVSVETASTTISSDTASTTTTSSDTIVPVITSVDDTAIEVTTELESVTDEPIVIIDAPAPDAPSETPVEDTTATP